MQRIFKKYTMIIMTFAIFSILAVNCYFSAQSVEQQQFTTFCTKIDQVIHTIKNNQEELAAIKTNLDEDYLTRARAAAYVVEKNPDILGSVEELNNLAKLLDVDELHVTEEDGIIRYSSVPKYIGLDFHYGEQMRGFLPILEGDDEDAYIIQEAQPNTAEKKMMKYVGVARKGVKGLVQVGLEPVRQMEAQERNTYEYIFSRFPTDIGEGFFAVDMEAGKITAYSGMNEDVNVSTDKLRAHPEKFQNGGYIQLKDGRDYYIVTKSYQDVIIGAFITRTNLYETFWKNMLHTLLYLAIVEMIVVLTLNYLVKQKVVNGIHEIRDELLEITKGDFDTTVNVGGNPEFEALSHGINSMVKSIVSSSARISNIIDISEIPLAAFEYQNGMNHVFTTTKLKDMLGISSEEFERLSYDPGAFMQKIKEIMEEPEEEESDVYCVAPDQYVRLHFAVELSGYYGAVTDASREVMDKRRMRYENNHDQLTGLARYVYFKELAAEILKNMKADEVCACVMIDLDEFKSINDTYGHDAGDRYLQEFAKCMKELPEDHCAIARRSGDEFCILLFGYREKGEIQEQLQEFWEKLNKRTVRLTEREACRISASGGYVCTNDRNAEVEQLLHEADQILYCVKREDKGSFGADPLGDLTEKQCHRT